MQMPKFVFLISFLPALLAGSVGSCEHCMMLEDIVTRCMFRNQPADALEVTERIAEGRAAEIRPETAVRAGRGPRDFTLPTYDNAPLRQLAVQLIGGIGTTDAAEFLEAY